jgi:hypothetical protein
MAWLATVTLAKITVNTEPGVAGVATAWLATVTLAGGGDHEVAVIPGADHDRRIMIGWAPTGCRGCWRPYGGSDCPTARRYDRPGIGATQAEKATSHPRDVTFLLTNPITEALTTKRHSTIRTLASPGSPRGSEFPGI